MPIPTPPECTNTSEVRVATCETTQDLQEWLTKTIADGSTTNYGAKSAAQLVSEAFSQYLQTNVSVKYVWVYDWADATARNAQVGMISGEYGHQIDTDAVYEYNGASWDLVTVAVGEQSYNVITSEVLKFATSWDLFYALASATQVDSNTTSIATLNKLDDSITIDMTADADQILTASQIPYGRIEITDIGTPITQQRTITLDNTEHTFLFVNNSDFPLNVIALGGTGIVVPNGEAKELRNDTVDVIDFEVSGFEIASTAEAQAGTDNTKAITPLRLREGLNASGTAPVFAPRAWVNFNGTGVVAIRASGNVSSITDNGTGDYTVNFITSMQDVNYSYNVNGKRSGATDRPLNMSQSETANYNSLVTSFRFRTWVEAAAATEDGAAVNVVVFR